MRNFTRLGALAAVIILLAGGRAFADSGEELSLAEMNGITGQFLSIDAGDDVIEDASNNTDDINVGVNSAQIVNSDIQVPTNVGVGSIQFNGDTDINAPTNIGIESVQINGQGQKDADSDTDKVEDPDIDLDIKKANLDFEGVSVMNSVNSAFSKVANEANISTRNDSAGDDTQTSEINASMNGAIGGGFANVTAGEQVIDQADSNSNANVGVNSAQLLRVSLSGGRINAGVASIQFNDFTIVDDLLNAGIRSVQLNGEAQKNASGINFVNTGFSLVANQTNIATRKNSDGDNSQRNSIIAGSMNGDGDGGLGNIAADNEVINNADDNTTTNVGVNSAQIRKRNIAAEVNAGVASIQFIFNSELNAETNAGIRSVQLNDEAQSYSNGINFVNAVSSRVANQLNIATRDDSQHGSGGLDTQINEIGYSMKVAGIGGLLDVTTKYDDIIATADDTRESNVGVNSAQVEGGRDITDQINAGVASIQLNDDTVLGDEANLGIDSVQLNDQAQTSIDGLNITNSAFSQVGNQTNIDVRTNYDSHGDLDQTNRITGGAMTLANAGGVLRLDSGEDVINSAENNGDQSNVGVNSAQFTMDDQDVFDAVNVGVASIQFNENSDIGDDLNAGIGSVQLNDEAQSFLHGVNTNNLAWSIVGNQTNISARDGESDGATTQTNTISEGSMVSGGAGGFLTAAADNDVIDFINENDDTNVGVNSAQLGSFEFHDLEDIANVGVASIQFNGETDTNDQANVGIRSVQLNDEAQREASGLNFVNAGYSLVANQTNISTREEDSGGTTNQTNTVDNSIGGGPVGGFLTIDAGDDVVHSADENSQSSIGVNSAQAVNLDIEDFANVGVASIQFNGNSDLNSESNVGIESVQVNDEGQKEISALNIVNAVGSIAANQTNVSMRNSSDGDDSQTNEILNNSLGIGSDPAGGFLDVTAEESIIGSAESNGENANIGVNSAQVNDVFRVDGNVNVGVASIQFNGDSDVNQELNDGILSVQLNADAQRSANAINLVNSVWSVIANQLNVSARVGSGSTGFTYQSNTISNGMN